jgi:feruloyl esterase
MDVTQAVAQTSGSFTIPPGQSGAGSVISGLPSFCEVSVVRTSPPATNQVHIEVWLPLDTWNDRFQGVGGGGYVSGISWSALATALRDGYSTASTDTGHPASEVNGSFALKPGGGLDWTAITDFAYRAIHEMTVVGKQVTGVFYGSNAEYTYFNGCSTGGRQALGEAERYPTDYNGILGGAPAVYFAQLSAAQLWPEVVMNRAHDFMPQCKFDAFRSAVISKCDALDGVTDGVIANLADCTYNPQTLVGTVTPCGVITPIDATVMAQIWRGPLTTGTATTRKFLWYGLEPGTDSAGLANTVTTNGVTTGAPFSIAAEWFQYWLTQDPSFDWTSLNTGAFARMFKQGVQEFQLLSTSNPTLTKFRDAGGKLVLWAGLSDQIIPPQGVIQYYNNVTAKMGGQNKTDAFARLFLAPGDGHCGGDSRGPVPANPFGTVVNWVENGAAPASMLATTADANGNVVESRPLCAYPRVARYLGHGSTSSAENFYCAKSFGRNS